MVTGRGWAITLLVCGPLDQTSTHSQRSKVRLDHFKFGHRCLLSFSLVTRTIRSSAGCGHYVSRRYGNIDVDAFCALSQCLVTLYTIEHSASHTTSAPHGEASSSAATTDRTRTTASILIPCQRASRYTRLALPGEVPSDGQIINGHEPSVPRLQNPTFCGRNEDVWTVIGQRS